MPDRKAEQALRVRTRRIARLAAQLEEERRTRREITQRLFYDHGYTQRKLAELWSDGGAPATEDAVQKALARAS